MRLLLIMRARAWPRKDDRLAIGGNVHVQSLLEDRREPRETRGIPNLCIQANTLPLKHVSATLEVVDCLRLIHTVGPP